MLNIFPIMFLSLLAHFLLRIILGGIFLFLAYRHARKDHEVIARAFGAKLPAFGKGAAWYFVFVEILIGTMLILGIYTQLAALAAFILALKILVFRSWFPQPAVPSSLFYTLVIGATLSLFITGAGAFAFDLPI